MSGYKTLKELSQAFPVYLVGGSVRDGIDTLFNHGEQGKRVVLRFSDTSKQPRPDPEILFSCFLGADTDIAGPLTDSEITDFLPEGWTSRPVNPRLGTLLLTKGAFQVEYTPFRTESYPAGGAHKPDDVRFSATVSEDALRRDFRINAVYYDVARDCLLDPLGGIADIGAKRIRLCTTSTLRHDGLRLLRLVRFEVCNGFRPDRETVRAAKRSAALLGDIAPERIRGELVRIFSCGRARWAVRRLQKYGLLSALGGKRFGIRINGRAAQNRYVAFLHAITGKTGEYLEPVAARVALTRAERAAVCLAAAIEKSCGIIAVADALDAGFKDEKVLSFRRFRKFARLKKRIARENLAVSVNDLAYRGEEFIADHPSVKRVGDALKQLRDRALIERVPNEKERLKELWNKRFA